MKRAFIMLLALCLAAAAAGCRDSRAPQSPTHTAPAATTAAVSTTAPDYGNTDFAGHWAVSEVYDAAGNQVTGSALEAIDTAFMLELLAGGVYFVYDAGGAVLGQGRYSVSADVMTLSAGGEEMVYVITDADTLRATAADGSVTVMTRLPEETPADPAEPEEEDAQNGEDDGEADIPEEEIPEQATADAAATATTD